MTLKPFLIAITVLIGGTFIGCSKGDGPPDPPIDPVVEYHDSLGKGWQRVVGGSNIVFDVFFANQQTGYASGGGPGGIIRSIDSGRTWKALTLPTESGVIPYHNLYFITPAKGWATANLGILKTTDSGNTWKKIPLSVTVLDLQFIDENTGYLATTGGLYKSTNGGDSWTVTAAFSTEVKGLFFRDATNGWISTGNKIVRTNDGGATVAYEADVRNVYYFQFFDMMNGLAIDQHGNLWKTGNGGTGWTNPLTIAATITDLHFFDPNNGYIMAGGAIYKTTDGGVTKTKIIKIDPDKGDSFVEVHFVDENHGWAITAQGGIFRYVQ